MERIQRQFLALRVLCLPVAGLTVLWLAGCSETGSDAAPGTGSSSVVTDGPPDIGAHADEHAHDGTAHKEAPAHK